MAPGGLEPPPADSKFGPESRRAETNRDDSPVGAVSGWSSPPWSRPISVGLVAPLWPHPNEPVSDQKWLSTLLCGDSAASV